MSWLPISLSKKRQWEDGLPSCDYEHMPLTLAKAISSICTGSRPSLPLPGHHSPNCILSCNINFLSPHKVYCDLSHFRNKQTNKKTKKKLLLTLQPSAATTSIFYSPLDQAYLKERVLLIVSISCPHHPHSFFCPRCPTDRALVTDNMTSPGCQTQWSFLRTHLTRPFSRIWHRCSVTPFWTTSFIWLPKYSSLLVPHRPH